MIVVQWDFDKKNRSYDCWPNSFRIMSTYEDNNDKFNGITFNAKICSVKRENVVRVDGANNEFWGP